MAKQFTNLFINYYTIIIIMKKFTISEAIDFIRLQSPFNSEAIRVISYLGNSQNKFKVHFNDDTFYFFDLDEQTFYKL